MRTYVWCEDSASGYAFWSAILQDIDAGITVQSKKSNAGLRKAIANLDDTENRYYVLVDSAVDNPDVLRELRAIDRYAMQKANVRIIRVHSFELVLLSFEFLESWIFAADDPLKDSRASQLKARELFVDFILRGAEPAELAAFKAQFSFPEHRNTEQIAARLLYEITRNTGFETNKGKLGACFISDCCDYADRSEDDLCGLDDCRLSAIEKKQQIITRSVIRSTFEEVGLL